MIKVPLLTLIRTKILGEKEITLNWQTINREIAEISVIVLNNFICFLCALPPVAFGFNFFLKWVPISFISTVEREAALSYYILFTSFIVLCTGSFYIRIIANFTLKNFELGCAKNKKDGWGFIFIWSTLTTGINSVIWTSWLLLVRSQVFTTWSINISRVHYLLVTILIQSIIFVVMQRLECFGFSIKRRNIPLYC